jgi:DnaJ domain
MADGALPMIPELIPGLGLKDNRPRLNQGADLTAHRLTPVEGFVLSRVDGSLTYQEICLISHLGTEATLDILRRLKREGLIVNPGDPLPAPEPAPRPTPVIGEPGPRAMPERKSLLERLDDGSSVRADEVGSGTDLSPEVKIRIVRLHRRLKRIGPYEILGLGRDADKASIRRAYYMASKELHPDRHYGKDLGEFREKLGDIFARLTDAFQTLDQKDQKDPKK